MVGNNNSGIFGNVRVTTKVVIKIVWLESE